MRAVDCKISSCIIIIIFFTLAANTQKVHAKIQDHRNPKKVKGGCGEPTVDLAIVKLPYVAPPGGPPNQGAVHVSLGGWSSSSTNFLVRFGEDYAPLFVGYDLLAIGKPFTCKHTIYPAKNGL